MEATAAQHEAAPMRQFKKCMTRSERELYKGAYNPADSEHQTQGGPRLRRRESGRWRRSGTE